MKRSEFIKKLELNKCYPLSYNAEDILNVMENIGLIEPDKKPSKLQEARGLCYEVFGNGDCGALEIQNSYESVIQEYQEVLTGAVIALDHPGCPACKAYREKIKELLED